MMGSPMVGFAMSPGENVDQVAALREKVAELQSDLLRLRQKLNASDARFRVLSDAAPVMIWMSGDDGLRTFFNRPWLEFRGRRLEEELGNRWVEGVHLEDRDLCVETYLKAFTARQPYRMQFRMMRRGGSYRWIE